MAILSTWCRPIAHLLSTHYPCLPSLPNLVRLPRQASVAPHLLCCSSLPQQNAESKVADLENGREEAAAAAEEEDEEEGGRKSGLSSKEKKELRAHAHRLGRKLVTQQIGKAGVTSALGRAISDTLEANELVKLKILDNSPDDVEVIIEKLEKLTHAQVVGNVGNTLIVYKPSTRKREKNKREKREIFKKATDF